MESGTVFKGIGVGSAAAVGTVVQFTGAPALPDNEPIPRTPEEIQRDSERLAAALAEVTDSLRAAAVGHEGQTLCEVLEAAAEMAADPSLREEANALIETGMGPAHAITAVTGQFAELFTAAGGYMAQRVTDLNSVRDRAVARLTGQPEPGAGNLTEPSVIIATDLSPADTATFDMDKVVALVTAEGGPTAHTSIIARQLGLPCVVRCPGVTDIPEGVQVAVDSAKGEIIIEPDEGLRRHIAQRAELLAELAKDTAPAATSDGHRIQLLANIGTVEDARAASQAPVEGVGLFRTEVLFLNDDQEPSIEKQAEAYREALKAFAGRKVVVRTLDAGADKPLAFANQEEEPNPALGVRAFRLVRTNPDLVSHQLKALAIAARDVPETQCWVMAPMISTATEAKQFAEMARGVGLTKIGIMVEVPAVALMAEQILAEVDFASIGTNDLAQYTMASDRLLGSLSDLIDRWQPAVLRLVAKTAKAGRDLGRPVGVCGESAADPLMALVLCGMGITSLSMSTTALPYVRYALRHTDLATCYRMAATAMNAPDGESGYRAVAAMLPEDVQEVLGV